MKPHEVKALIAAQLLSGAMAAGHTLTDYLGSEALRAAEYLLSESKRRDR